MFMQSQTINSHLFPTYWAKRGKEYFTDIETYCNESGFETHYKNLPFELYLFKYLFIYFHLEY